MKKRSRESPRVLGKLVHEVSVLEEPNPKDEKKLGKEGINSQYAYSNEQWYSKMNSDPGQNEHRAVTKLNCFTLAYFSRFHFKVFHSFNMHLFRIKILLYISTINLSHLVINVP